MELRARSDVGEQVIVLRFILIFFVFSIAGWELRVRSNVCERVIMVHFLIIPLPAGMNFYVRVINQI